MASEPLTPSEGLRVVAKQTRSSFSEIGRSGIRRFAGQIYEEFLPSLRGTQGIKVYREMRDNDPIIGATMYAIEQVIEKASWTIHPAGKSALDLKAANFLKTCMHDMEHTWQDFISECLSFLTYGWVWCELVYKIRKGESNNPKTNSKENDGLIGWRKLPRRVQSSFYNWEYNEESGDLEAFSQMAPPDYMVRTIPLEKSFHLRTKLDGNNPEGRSVLRNAYRPWYFKKNMEEIEAIGVERDLVGLPIFTPPEGFDIDATENSAIKNEVKKIISNLRRDEQEGVCLPTGWTLELLAIGGSRRQFDMDKIINRYDKRIAATVLAQFIMLGMDRVGSFALSRNQNDLFLVAVQSMLSKIAAGLNNGPIPKLFALNPEFAPLGSAIPVLTPGKVTDPNLDELSNYVSRLAGKGFMLPKEHIITELETIAGLSNQDVEQVGEIDPEADGENLIISPILPQQGLFSPPGQGQNPPQNAQNGPKKPQNGPKKPQNAQNRQKEPQDQAKEE